MFHLVGTPTYGVSVVVAQCMMVLFFLAGCDESEGVDDGDAPRDTDPEDTEIPPRHLDTDTGFVNEDGVVYPGVNWPTVDPEEAGLDPEGLEDAAALAEENDSHCLVVTKGGRIAGEWYFGDWDPGSEGNVFSVTKAVAGLVVGMAETQGLLDIEQPASSFISDWDGSDSESVLIRHLLSNTSGREWDFNTDYLGLAMEGDKTGFAVSLEQAADPGTHWEYNNSAVQTLDAVLTEAIGGPVDEYAGTELFEPIGAVSTFSRDQKSNTLVYSELRASCRDLARFGYLILREGKWGDEQLIDGDYIVEATTPSSELNSAYGYLWWLNREGHWVLPTTSADGERIEGDGKMIPPAPEHLVLAKGLQAQLIVVDSQNDIVFTRIGGDDNPVTAVMNGYDPTNDGAFIVGLIDGVLGAVVEDK